MGEGGRPALDIYSTPQRVGLDLEEARAPQQTCAQKNDPFQMSQGETPQQEVGPACSSQTPWDTHEKADATTQDPGHGQLSLAQGHN